MTTPDKILVHLLDGPRSAAALGESLRIPELVAKANCDRHRTTGLVDLASCGDGVLYQLKSAGREAANTLKSTQLAL